jgi:site-specific DNA-cytosine methylase
VDHSQKFTHIGLCAGYGGIELGLKRVLPTLRSVALCEIEAFPIANLVAKMEAGLMDAAPVWTDLKTFPWESFRDRVDILTGGYPCQPFSAAGKRAGKDDPRHLWPWIADGIRILRPRLCFFENVEGHISLGLSSVISDLEELGYQVSWGIFSAREVGAPHQRKRVFIMAYDSSKGLEGLRQCCDEERWEAQIGHAGSCGDSWQGRLADPNHQHGHGEERGGNPEAQGIPSEHWQEEHSRREPWGADAAGHQAWPSRPGEPQYAWEPPRVVGNAESADCQKGSCDHRKESGAISDTQQVESGGGDCGSLRDGNRETQPTLGLHSDESSSFLGQALTLKPYGDNVIAYENISNKIRARKVLFNLWREVVSQKIQWTTRGLQYLLAEKVLQSRVQLDSFTQRICYFVWCIQTGHKTQGWGLHGMWVYETCGNSPQGQEPIEQLKRELGYAMCQLSYEIALGGRKDAVETESILQGVRESSERAWSLSQALPEMEEVWRSSLDQKVWEKGCYIEAASIGNRTDELRLLGNGVVPATAERAFRTLLKELYGN